MSSPRTVIDLLTECNLLLGSDVNYDANKITVDAFGKSTMYLFLNDIYCAFDNFELDNPDEAAAMVEHLRYTAKTFTSTQD